MYTIYVYAYINKLKCEDVKRNISKRKSKKNS